MDSIAAALVSAEFIRGAALLALTAVLTGFLVPQIAEALAERRHRKQKLFEAELTRQRDVLAAQSELLRNMSKIAWRLQLLNIAVSFYRLGGNQASYDKASERYEAEAADLLGQLRAELSTSKRLVSTALYGKLRTLYFETLLPIDAKLHALIRNNATSTMEEWERQHDTSFRVAQTEIENVLADLALELQLTSPTANVGA